MSTAAMKEMTREALQDSRAVGAFNILDYCSMKAVVHAAEEENTPVIIQTSVKTVKLWGYRAIRSWYTELAEPAGVPVALHLDHCKELDVIENCIAAGWTSVMIDASSFPLEENIALTRRVLDMAGPKGISVEAELGEIGGVEDDISVTNGTYADPEKAARFLREAPVDVFAPSIGTAHGVYKGEPKISFEIIEKISRENRVPLALHGGTGLSDDVFRRCIALGCSKVNISTLLKLTFIESFETYRSQNPGVNEPVKILSFQYDVLKEKTAEKIRLFSGGRV